MDPLEFLEGMYAKYGGVMYDVLNTPVLTAVVTLSGLFLFFLFLLLCTFFEIKIIF